MKLKVKRLGHVESGTYKVEIVSEEAQVSKQGNDICMLTMKVVSGGKHQGTHFLHSLLADGRADFYIDRLCRAAGIEYETDEFDTAELVGRKVIVELENKKRPGGLLNYFPQVAGVYAAEGDDD